MHHKFKSVNITNAEHTQSVLNTVSTALFILGAALSVIPGVGAGLFTAGLALSGIAGAASGATSAEISNASYHQGLSSKSQRVRGMVLGSLETIIGVASAVGATPLSSALSTRIEKTIVFTSDVGKTGIILRKIGGYVVSSAILAGATAGVFSAISNGDFSKGATGWQKLSAANSVLGGLVSSKVAMAGIISTQNVDAFSNSDVTTAYNKISPYNPLPTVNELEEEYNLSNDEASVLQGRFRKLDIQNRITTRPLNSEQQMQDPAYQKRMVGAWRSPSSRSALPTADVPVGQIMGTYDPTENISVAQAYPLGYTSVNALRAYPLAVTTPEATEITMASPGIFSLWTRVFS
jgi:hypothetical protein